MLDHHVFHRWTTIDIINLKAYNIIDSLSTPNIVNNIILVDTSKIIIVFGLGTVVLWSHAENATFSTYQPTVIHRHAFSGKLHFLRLKSHISILFFCFCKVWQTIFKFKLKGSNAHQHKQKHSTFYVFASTISLKLTVCRESNDVDKQRILAFWNFEIHFFCRNCVLLRKK